MTFLGIVHTSFALLATMLGGIVVVRRKGTAQHKLIGRMYVGSMFGLNGTALCDYRLYGHFGPFHWLALSSLASVMVALLFVVRKKPKNWLGLHGETMQWSYVGLLAAAVSEISVRVLAYPFGKTVAISSLLVIVVGGTMTRLKMRRLYAQQSLA